MRKLLFLIAITTLILSGCTKTNESSTDPSGFVKSKPRISLFSTTFDETFETGSKTSYAAADVTLTTGSWNLNDALIGTSASDVKTGTASARIRNVGAVTMNFNVTSASTVTVDHALYGTDGSSTWQLMASTNNGSSYYQVGSTVTTSSSTLNTVTFTVNVNGNIRFQILKASGGTNRINIDNITINPYSVVTVPDNDNLLLGNPTNAAFTIDSTTNYLMVKPSYYTLSYNSVKGEPNWVSWHLYSGDLGLTDRLNNFRRDSTLPASWYWVNQNSYVGTGFDRGHNCPSGDRTLNTDYNSATFLMSNMIPQAPNNNEQTWSSMEGYIRTQITAGMEAFIVMGSYGSGGTGSNGGVTTTIDNGHVAVPSNIWKVVVLIPNGNNDLNRIDTSARVITVNTPNVNTINSNWKLYRTSVNSIEAATGYHLFNNLPSSIATYLKAKIDTQ